MKLEREIAQILNKYNEEAASNTPDFILASYLTDCLAAFDRAVKKRAEWYGRMDVPGQGTKIVKLDKTKFCPGCGSSDPVVGFPIADYNGPCEHPWHLA